jgi:histidyl-tRNA synthetase
VGLTGYRLDLTSLGDATCRPAYRERLTAFLAGLDLDEATRLRAEVNPLRVLDDKRPAMQALLVDAPLMLDHLCDSCREHFDQVRVVLDALGVRYVLNPRMVRGLDYYTRTTFEFVHPGLGAQSGMGGGGRYDGLMAELGGQSLSGIGFGLGVDRTMMAAQAEGVSVGDQSRCEVYGVPMGAAASLRLAVISGELRRAGVRTDLAYGGRALKTAMKAADASGAKVALVLGDRELQDGTVMIRNLTTGEQQPTAQSDVLAAVQAILS